MLVHICAVPFKHLVCKTNAGGPVSPCSFLHACCRFRVLDECDEMLNMGFVDDVEMILNAGGSSENMQTLLFSATLPPWVKDITRRFLRKEQRLVDLVGTQKMKVSPQSAIHANKTERLSFSFCHTSCYRSVSLQMQMLRQQSAAMTIPLQLVCCSNPAN